VKRKKNEKKNGELSYPARIPSCASASIIIQNGITGARILAKGGSTIINHGVACGARISGGTIARISIDPIFTCRTV